MGSTGVKRTRRRVAALVGVAAAAVLLTGCFDREFGSGSLVDVNDDGIAVGERRYQDEVGNLLTRVMAIDTATGEEWRLPQGPFESTPAPVGVTADGTVYAMRSDAFPNTVGVRWTPSTGEVEELPKGSFDGIFVGAVSDGGVAGGYGRTNDGLFPILIDGDEVIDLRDTPGAPVDDLSFAQVRGVNDAGQVIGEAFYDGATHMFAWDAVNGWRFMPGDGRSFQAVNGSGVIVGNMWDTGVNQYRQAWYDWATLTPHPVGELGVLTDVNDQDMAIGRGVRINGESLKEVQVCVDLDSGAITTELNEPGTTYFAHAMNEAGAVVGTSHHSRAGMWEAGTCVPSP